MVWNRLILDPSDGVFGPFDLAALLPHEFFVCSLPSSQDMPQPRPSFRAHLLPCGPMKIWKHRSPPSGRALRAPLQTITGLTLKIVSWVLFDVPFYVPLLWLINACWNSSLSRQVSNHYVVDWLFGRAATAVLASLRTRYHYRCAYEPMIRTHLHLDTCLLRYGFLDILALV